MKEHPILFSGAMVRAILVGRKTMTRRVMKPQPKGAPDNVRAIEVIAAEMLAGDCCPYGQPGDRLWVRETWADVRGMFDPDLFPCGYAYRCDSDDEALEIARGYGVCWKPSIFCPRCASRITLEVTAVRVERLQDITEEDAEAEGVGPIIPTEADWWMPRRPYASMFLQLWESINAKRGFGWDVNPWLWVVSFRRLTP